MILYPHVESFQIFLAIVALLAAICSAGVAYSFDDIIYAPIRGKYRTLLSDGKQRI